MERRGLAEVAGQELVGAHRLGPDGPPGSGRMSVLKDSPSRITPERIGTIPTAMIGSCRGSSPPVSRSSAQ